MKKIYYYLSLSCFLLVSVVTHAQQWTPTNGPFGGEANIVVSTGGLTLAQTHHGLYRSTSPDVWWKVPSVPRFNGMVALNNFIFGVGTKDGVNGCFRSSDGINWFPLRSVPGERFYMIRESAPYLALISEAGTTFKIHLSQDMGQTWTTRDLPGGAYVTSADIYYNEIAVATNTRRLYYSDNFGSTWRDVNFTAPSSINDIALYASHLVVGTSTVHISPDRGYTWIHKPEAGSGYKVFNQDGVFYIGNWRTGLKRSFDRGFSWENLPAVNFSVNSVAFNSNTHNTYFATSAGVFRSPDYGRQVIEMTRMMASHNYFPSGANLATDGTNLFAATVHGGVFKSPDAGATWISLKNGLSGMQLFNTAVLVNNGKLFVGAIDHPMLSSNDQGITWSSNANIGYLRVSFLGSGNTVFAGGPKNYGAAVFKSNDNGATWFPSDNGFPPSSGVVTSFVRAGDAVYAAHSDGVYKSSDLGSSWFRLPSSPPQEAQMLFASENFLYLIAGYNSLYRSADGGATFIKMSVAGNPSLSCFAEYQGVLFMGTTRGVLYSTDNGSTWNSYGLADQAVSSLVVMSENLYAGINGSEVMKAPLLINSVTFDPIPSKIYGDAPFTLQASTNSGLPITFSSDNPAAIIQGNLVTIRGTGTVTITASIPDNVNTSARQTLTIEKAPLVAKANDASWQYGSPAQPLSISYSGFVYDDTEYKITAPTILLEPADAVNAGQYQISLTGGAAANYNITTQPGILTITRAPLQAIANNASMIYGDNVPPLSITYNGFIGTDDVSSLDQPPLAVAAIPLPAIAKETTNVEQEAAPATKPADGSMEEAVAVKSSFPDVGQYAINISGGTDNNYEIIPVSGVLTVDKAPLVIIAENKLREYGDENPPFTFLYEGFKGADNATMIDQHPVASTNAGLFSDAGEEYLITLEGGADKNYDLFYQSGTFTIVQAPLMIQFADQVVEYGGEVQLDAQSLIYIISGLKGADRVESMDTPIEISIHEPRVAEGTQFINAGSYAIVMTQGADKNYLLDFLPGTLYVTKADLYARPFHVNKIYGDANPEFQIEFAGFKGTETQSIIDQFPTISTTADLMSPAGDYLITLSGGMDDNYNIIIGEAGVLQVVQATLNVFAESKFKTYGDATSEPLTIRYEGFKGTDDESVIDQAPSVSSTVSAISGAGEYAIILEGGYDNNYILSFFNGIYTVKKANLFATAESMETMYGDILPKPWPITYSGFVGTDDISSIDVLPQAGPKVPLDAMEIKNVPNAGKYLIGVGGGADKNYEIIPVHGTLVINKARLYVSYPPVESVYGDIVPKIVLQYHGFKASDGFKIVDGPGNLEKIPLASTETKPIDAGTYPVTISGGSDNNYYFEYFSEGYVLIQRAPLKIWIEPQTIEYGNDAQIAFDWKYDGFKGTEDASVLSSPPIGVVYETARPDGSHFRLAGTHEILLIGGGDNNYAFDYVASFVHINKAPLIARPVFAARTYGEPNPEFAIEYSGLKGLETASVIDDPPFASTTAGLSSPVGTYPVSLSGGLDNNYDFFFEDGTLEITPAKLIVTAGNKSKMYGQEFYTSLSILYDGFKGTDDATVLDMQPTVSTTVTGTSDAGTYPIIVEGGSDHNYTFTYVNGIFTVNKVMLTAEADDKTKVYGEENPEFTITYTGFVNGEDKTVIDMAPCLINPPDPLSAPGTYPITFDGGSDINYDFDHVPGILTITELTTPVAGKPTATCYLTSPANNATNVNYYVTLTANFVVGARVYTMEVNTSNDFSGTSIVKQGGQNIPFLLDHDTRYYVRIQTDQAPDVWSVVSTFTTGNPLTLTYLNSPEDGATSVPTNVKVTANNLYGATSYKIELNTLSDFTGTSFLEISDGRSITFKKLEQATTYFARVTTDLTPGQWGPVTSFRTLDPRARTKAWQESEESDFETEGISYHVYPNPFKEKVSILVQSLEQMPLEMSLFDMNGKMVEGKGGSTNNLLELGESVSHGVYLLKVVSGGKMKLIRLIKQGN